MTEGGDGVIVGVADAAPVGRHWAPAPDPAGPGALVSLAVRRRRFALRQAIVDVASAGQDGDPAGAEGKRLAETAARAALELAEVGDGDGLSDILRPDPDTTDVTWTVACYQIGDLTPTAIRDFAEPVAAVTTLARCPEPSHIAAELVASTPDGLRWTVLDRAGTVLRLHLLGEDRTAAEAVPADPTLAAARRRWERRLASWHAETEPTTPIATAPAAAPVVDPVDAAWSVRSWVDAPTVVPPPVAAEPARPADATRLAGRPEGRAVEADPRWRTAAIEAVMALAAGAGLTYDLRPRAASPDAASPGDAAADAASAPVAPAAGAPVAEADRPSPAVDRLEAIAASFEAQRDRLERIGASFETQRTHLERVADALETRRAHLDDTAARVERVATAHAAAAEAASAHLERTLVHHAAELEEAVTDHIVELEAARRAATTEVAGLATGLSRVAAGLERLEERLRRLEAANAERASTARRAPTVTLTFTLPEVTLPAWAQRTRPSAARPAPASAHPWLRRLRTLLGRWLTAPPPGPRPGPAAVVLPIDTRSSPP